MKVISNSSPLIALGRIGRVEILRRLYSELYVPAAVWSEVTLQAEQPGAMLVRESAWIHQVSVRNNLWYCH